MPKSLTSEQMAELIETAVASTGPARSAAIFPPRPKRSFSFRCACRLARYGIVPPGKITLRKKMFANQSEEMFANLLDFYRIAWEYEPRSFPVQ